MSEAAETEKPADSKELLSQDLAATMPKVDLQAVTTAAKDQKPAENQQENSQSSSRETPVTDSMRRLFDPLLHETDADGKPVLRKDGKRLKCRRTPLKGYQKESKVFEEPAAAEQQQQQPEIEQQPEPVDAEKAEAMQLAGAATCAGLQLYMMRLGLGDHVGNNDLDRDALTGAWRDVFAHYGVGAVHPVIGLALVSGAITMKALDKPEARTRWQRGTLWLKLKIGGMWHWLMSRNEPIKPKKAETAERDKAEAD